MIEYLGNKYSINEKEKIAQLLECRKDNNELIIPQSINCEFIDYIVTSISKDAFRNSEITSISIPSNFIEFEEGWSNYTKKVTQINVDERNPYLKSYENKYILKKSSPNSVNYDVLTFSVRDIQTAVIPSFINRIDKYAFGGCKQLQQIEISTDSKLEVIDDEAFLGSTIRNIKIPSHLTKIGKYSFSFCHQLQRVEILKDSKLQIIDDHAFYNCSIESLTIPSNLVELKSGWCSNTPNLNEVVVDSSNRFYKSYENKFILKKSSNKSNNFDWIEFCVRNIKKVTIPSFIKIIGEYSFLQCNRLRKIEIPSDSHLNTIYFYAFSESAIECISIPDDLTYISQYAFYSCIQLKYVKISSYSKLRIIDENAFFQSSIESLIIPSHVSRIGENAFGSCHELQIIEFEENSELIRIDISIFEFSEQAILMIPLNLSRRLKLSL